ncbi:MAG: sulfate/molybdate ABC transporter ATP-binding protein [Xanthobacteraceae bacterium]
MRIDVKSLSKRFEETVVLDRINLEVRPKEFLGLLGPSGSGKTTLLRILGGLEHLDEGLVELDARDASTLPFDERRVGFVFQQYALFDHMTVFENVAFGLRVRPRPKRPTPTQITERVKELLGLVQLGGFEHRFPGQLSGGQRQRVALARTLAVDPQILLLDEPFGALDAKVRVDLRRSLRDIHDTSGLTTIFVTHDQEEALGLADRVALMNRGRIEQIGSPAEIYESPKTPFVFDFLGRTNAFPCTIQGGKARLGDKELPADPGGRDGPGIAFVRPHDVVLSPPDDPTPTADAKLPGIAIVRFMSALGQRVTAELLYEKKLVEAELSRATANELALKVGGKCTVSLRLPRIYPRQEAEQQTATAVQTGSGNRRRLRKRLRARFIPPPD